MAPLRWPAPLREGDWVFVTAPSSGVPRALQPRLERALDALRARGLRVRVGSCLNGEGDGGVATAAQRAAEWQAALLDPEVSAVMAPWGGELAIELLPHLDCEALRAASPKWVSGFSDLSTLALPLCLRAGWVSLHSPNLMELGAASLDATTAALFEALFQAQPQEWTQAASRLHASPQSVDWALEPAAGLRLDQPTRPRLLREDMPRRAEGRLIGGCLETLSRIAGTAHAPLQSLSGPHLLYLECAEASPYEVARSLHSLALHGWFENLSALLIGRSAGTPAQTADGFSGWQVLDDLLADFRGPVLLDLDIGHVPPQWTLANGAWAELQLDDDGVHLCQRWGTA